MVLGGHGSMRCRSCHCRCDLWPKQPLAASRAQSSPWRWCISYSAASSSRTGGWASEKNGAQRAGWHAKRDNCLVGVIPALSSVQCLDQDLPCSLASQPPAHCSASDDSHGDGRTDCWGRVETRAAKGAAKGAAKIGAEAADRRRIFVMRAVEPPGRIELVASRHGIGAMLSLVLMPVLCHSNAHGRLSCWASSSLACSKRQTGQAEHSCRVEMAELWS